MRTTEPLHTAGAMLLTAIRACARRWRRKIIRFTPSPMAKMLAILFGVIFVVVGVLGFVPNPLVGAGALFDANTAHNIVHLAVGLVLLAIAFWASAKSALWLKILGAVYLLVAVLGFVMPSPLLGIIEINSADNWLHVLLGVVLILAGLWSHEESMAMNTAMPMQGGNSGSTPGTQM